MGNKKYAGIAVAYISDHSPAKLRLDRVKPCRMLHTYYYYRRKDNAASKILAGAIGTTLEIYWYGPDNKAESTT